MSLDTMHYGFHRSPSEPMKQAEAKIGEKRYAMLLLYSKCKKGICIVGDNSLEPKVRSKRGVGDHPLDPTLSNNLGVMHKGLLIMNFVAK